MNGSRENYVSSRQTIRNILAMDGVAALARDEELRRDYTGLRGFVGGFVPVSAHDTIDSHISLIAKELGVRLAETDEPREAYAVGPFYVPGEGSIIRGIALWVRRTDSAVGMVE